MGTVWLASASKRRHSWLSEELGKFGDKVKVCQIEYSEPEPRAGTEVKAQVEEACMHKANAASSTLVVGGGDDGRIIVVSDTLVEDPDDHKVALGKPADVATAASTLIRLSGRRHRVWSSTAIIQKGIGEIELDNGWMASLWTDYSIVEFEEIQEAVLKEMLDRGSWIGKAGGYDLARTAGEFSRLIEGEEVDVLGFSSRARNELAERWP